MNTVFLIGIRQKYWLWFNTHSLKLRIFNCTDFICCNIPVSLVKFIRFLLKLPFPFLCSLKSSLPGSPDHVILALASYLHTRLFPDALVHKPIFFSLSKSLVITFCDCMWNWLWEHFPHSVSKEDGKKLSFLFSASFLGLGWPCSLGYLQCRNCITIDSVSWE